MSDWRELCGYPRIPEKTPDRPECADGDIWEFLDEEKYPEQVPHSLDIRAQNEYRWTENIYFVFQLYLKFLDLGLYPPKWVLEVLAEGLRRHMASPDPELFASQMHVSGHASGATNPHKQFSDWPERHGALTEIMILLGGFDIKFIEAIRAVKARDSLAISEKRIGAMFREEYGGHQIFLARNRPEPWDDPLMLLDEDGVAEYINSFPRKFHSLLRRKRRVKT